MAHSERHEELVAAASLGIQDGPDQADLTRHLAEGCPVCEELLRDFRCAAAAMAAGVRPVTPAPDVRLAILASLGPARASAARPAAPAAWRGFAAAAALLLVAVVLDDARLRRQGEDLRSQSAALAGRLQSAQTALAERVLRARVLESDDVQMMLLGGKSPQPGARGRVFWSPGAKRGILVASNLGALPTDHQYELWVFLNGKPVNAGVFDADASGHALFESTVFPEPGAQNFAVTIEPRGGLPAPSGPAVLVGAPA
jgi:anti-sigma-K factor RskA